MAPEPPHQRAGDIGWLCWVAARASDAWDWIDRRQIDAYVMSVVIMIGTIKITDWAMHFAEHSTRPGLEVASCIAAVMGPWSILQAAAVKFFFDARQGSFLPGHGVDRDLADRRRGGRRDDGA